MITGELPLDLMITGELPLTELEYFPCPLGTTCFDQRINGSEAHQRQGSLFGCVDDHKIFWVFALWIYIHKVQIVGKGIHTFLVCVGNNTHLTG